MLTYAWAKDGILILRVTVQKRVHGELLDDTAKIAIPPEDIGPLRYLLAQGPPARAGERDSDRVAGQVAKE